MTGLPINGKVVTENKMAAMHLSYSTSSYKGQKYKSYSIAESYREGNTVRKRIIWPIGKLTDPQAEQIKLIVALVHGEQEVVTRLQDLVVCPRSSALDYGNLISLRCLLKLEMPIEKCNEL